MTSTKPSRGRRTLTLDPRLLIGVALVVASVAGVVALVSTADQTIDVVAARVPLAPGDHVDASDLTTVAVRLDAAANLYLAPDEVPAAGVVVTRPVAKGELVPVGAVGSAESLRLSALVLRVEGVLPESVQPGSRVDVWSAPQGEGGQFGPPAVIAPSSTVVRVVSSDSLVASGDTVSIEVLVAKARVARVLEAVANSGAISLVPAAIPVR